MDEIWQRAPKQAYADWQASEAAGADGRPFSKQSVVQHRAMFDRFHRYLVSRGTTVATFSADVLDGFWLQGDAVHYSPATRMRYLKLIDRLCRHLVAIGVRDANPAHALLVGQRWPLEDPDVLFLPEDVDRDLQDYVQPQTKDEPGMLQKRAIIALFLGAGVTASEGRAARVQDLNPNASPPYLHVPARFPKSSRTIHIAPFAVPTLSAWLSARPAWHVDGDLLFSLKRVGTPVTDMSLGKIVREAFSAIGHKAEDMGPRILRNTYCRRLLILGVAPAEVTERLGLASNRTVTRIAATIKTAVSHP